MHNKNKIAEVIRNWLNFLWNRSPMSKAENFPKDPFTANSMVLKSPKGKQTV
jgi:hypothetical protein